MSTQFLRDAAAHLVAAADYADNPATVNASFNWMGLLQIIATLVPQIIALFTGAAPAPLPPAPTPPAPVVPPAPAH